MSVPAGPDVPMQMPMFPSAARVIALGHVAGAFDVAGQDVVDAAVGAHRRVERVDRRAWQAESLGGALLFQDGDGCVNRAHLRHGFLKSVFSGV